MKLVQETPKAEPDMTPMIDMTFQLIAFFMVLMNFSECDADERIRLPSSELAKPPDKPVDTPVTLQLTNKGMVIFNAQERPVMGIEPDLRREAMGLQALGKNPKTATMIIRADRRAKTGNVQELILMCQKAGFEKFVLRTKSDTKKK
jgi:biopolymer transport protein ExbD